MNQQPILADTPPPDAPARKINLRWLIIVGGIVIGLGVLIYLVAVLAPLITPVERSNLVLACTEFYTASAMSVCAWAGDTRRFYQCKASVCSQWADDVQDTPEYRACRDQATTGTFTDPNLLYRCLVEQGVGPE